MSDELTPITRKEVFLAKAGGQSVETPTPITREETFLQAIIDNGSGGGGGGGGALIVNDVDGTLDKTWREINDNPSAVIKVADGPQTTVFHIGILAENEGSYALVAFSYNMDSVLSEVYVTNSIDGYPVKMG